MSGVNDRLVRQCVDLFADAGEQDVLIAARQVPATDSAAEQDVAPKGFQGWFMKKNDAARAMAWCKQEPEFEPIQEERFAFVEEVIDLDRLHFEAEPMASEEIGLADHRVGVVVAEDLATVARHDFCSVDRVVEMAVGQEQRVDLLVGESTGGSVRCVHEKGAVRCLNEVGIGFEQAAGNFFELEHDFTGQRSHNLISTPNSANFVLMTIKRFLAVALIGAMVLPTGRLTAADEQADYGQIAASVARLLEQGHYTRRKLDQNMGRKVLETYLEQLDYNKLFFTQEDVDEFRAKYSDRLHQDILSGRLGAAYDIFSRFKFRVEDRVAKVKEAIKKEYTFDSDRTIQLNRKDAKWPANDAEADRLWRDRIEGELLEVELNEHERRSPRETVEKRYDQLLRSVRQQEAEDVVKTYLSALAQTYDPHSEYLSPRDLKNFEISMGLSLVGIGAVLSSEEGYAKIMEIVPGGPASKDGELQVNDRVAAVAQGDKPFEDVVDMKLDKVVEKIRGEKGTVVRLQVIPATATDPSERVVIDITRDKVQFKDQAASAELIEYESSAGKSHKVGLISLPSFYQGKEDETGEVRRTTDDVAMLLERLKEEGIEGLVIDLRQDGGGSLEEAIKLTGLFIPEGPVVQAKDPNGKIRVSYDEDPTVAYDGPLVVLTNRFSASASEIFAAALQDYGRAVIVGDSQTFGKGTVQTMLDVGRFMPFFSLGSSDAGALKLTIQKFYRVNGGATQTRGVEADIVLPSMTDLAEFGESALRHPLPYDEVERLPLRDGQAEGSLFVDQLRARSAARVATNPEFQYITEDVERLQEKRDRNEISLNEEQRRKERVADRKRGEERNDARAQRQETGIERFSLTLDDLDKAELEPVSNTAKASSGKLHPAGPLQPVPEESASPDGESESDSSEDDVILVDATKNEAIRILADLIALRSNETPTRTAQVRPDSSEEKSE